MKNCKNGNLLGTPDTSFRGLNTRNVRNMARSGPVAFPSSDFGINIGRNLGTGIEIKTLISFVSKYVQQIIEVISTTIFK